MTMTAAFRAVLEESKRRSVGMRDAAYLIAVNRVARAAANAAGSRRAARGKP